MIYRRSPQISKKVKTFFPEDFFIKSPKPYKSPSPFQRVRLQVTKKIKLKLTPQKIKEGREITNYKPKTLFTKKENNLTNDNMDKDSTNSGSMHFIGYNKGSDDFSFDNNNNNNNDNLLKETPHFFPCVDAHVGEKNENKGNLSNIFSYKKKENKTLNLPSINKERSVEQEISNLFENLTDGLVNDPDINKKMNILLDNIQDVKKAILYKKKSTATKNIEKSKQKKEIREERKIKILTKLPNEFLYKKKINNTKI